MYYTQYKQVDDYPFTFTQTPSIQMNMHGERDGVIVISGYGSATTPPTACFMRPSSVTDAFELACNFRAEGWWK